MDPQHVARWAPGEDIVIAWPGGIALVDESVGLGAAERIWSRLHRDSQLGTFLKTLAESSETGFLDLPAFAVAIQSVDRCHVAVRGPVPVEAQVGGTTETISGESVMTWAEKVIPLPDAIRLGGARSSADGGPVVDGVLRASGIERGVFRAAAETSATPVAVSVYQPPSEQRDVPSNAESPKPVVELVAEADPVLMLPAQPGDRIDEPSEQPSPDPDRTRSGFTAAHETLNDDEPVIEVEEPVAVNPYASLWDPSVALDIEAAAIRPKDEVQPAVPGSRSGYSEVSDAQLSGDTVLEDGMAQVVMERVAAGPSVLARFCDRGHPNPPDRGHCYVCQARVSGDARMVERPQLGYLRVEGGETVPLKGPIIAGRNPRSTALKLSETPRLMALPHAHVSGTHVAFLLEGWRVMVRDLNSSNGTYLRRHGKPAVRLPDTPVLLIPGDLIDLGKGLFIHLEGTP
ncbi:FHA domain-containing protein [Tessaracoccus caeni]|uniref:FHA domain-containing protein n=1 Tax=Tessaracoccus caeni TaxID=3031239 RepID=UPI0023DB48A9|nr:FHA domain-containing protein [Tessaracoccus caeni]MDF1487697.1 FHA domain-containing protein [Tessaracoccus caeni]